MTAQLKLRGDVAVLVPAAGPGVRLGPGAPKALRAAAPASRCWCTRSAGSAAAPVACALIVVAAPGRRGRRGRASCSRPVAPVTVVAGGATGRSRWPPRWPPCRADFEIVLVHDAARALTPPELVERGGGRGPRRATGAVIPVLPVVDTIKQVDADGRGRSAPSTGPRCARADPAGLPPRRADRRARRRRSTRSPTTPAWSRRSGYPVHCVPGSEGP